MPPLSPVRPLVAAPKALNSRGPLTAVAGACLATILATALTPALAAPANAAQRKPSAPAASATATGSSATWSYRTLTNPSRTQVLSGTTVLATFTRGARTVVLSGPSRTFGESTTSATVTTTAWVRLLSAPFAGTVDTSWLTTALGDTRPDVLAIAAGYLTGAPPVLASDGQRISSDAHYGPLQADGTRAEGSDFNDYLGVTWTYGATTDRPEADQIESLDCSGYVRMVMGYRSHLPLSLDPDGGASLPRRAFQMLASAPGVVTVPNTGVRPSSTASLSPGDLVFFDASTDDGTQIDHVGIYLGKDSAGAPRFLSSRKTVDGPTMGDVGGRSTLSGTGLYATSWRASRRL